MIRARRRAAAAALAIASACGGCADETPPNDARSEAAARSTPPADTATVAVPPSVRDELTRLIASGKLGEAQLRLDAIGPEVIHGDAQLALLQALVHHGRKQYARARPDFERAVALGNDTAAHFLGYCAYYLGDMPAARAAFERHLTATPDEPDSHFGLGLVALAQGELDAAERAFTAAIDLTEALRETDPRKYAMRRIDHAKAHARLADVHLARGDYAAARTELLRSLDFHREHASVFHTLAMVEERLGDPEAARAARTTYRRLEAERTGREPAAVPFAMTDVTATSGVALTPESGHVPSTQILEVKGGGLALIDADADGDLDLFVPNGATLDDPEHGPGARYFENVSSGGAIRFRDATADSGVGVLTRWAMGATVGDFDGDGHDDIAVTCYGPNALLRGDGQGHFADVAATAGVDDPAWSTAAAFGDLDADGDLDLYVANYLDFDAAHPPPPSSFRGEPVLAGPKGLAPAPDTLYENLGNGTFRDASGTSGVHALAPAYGLGVAILDLDGDGGLDVFVGNDSMPNFQWRRTGPFAFEDVAPRTGLSANGAGSPQATMGIAIGDVDGNGRPDLFTTNFASDTNTLHVGVAAGGLGFFDDATSRFGLGMVSYQFLGWACAFVDLDHDGDEDLLAFNGHVYPNASEETMNAPYLQAPLLFERDGARFRRVPPDEDHAWLAAAHCDRGAVFGDLDRDGDIDVVVRELNGPLRVLRNDRDDANGGWIVVAPERPVGCTIALRAGAAVQRRWLAGGAGFLSASALEAHAVFPGADAVDVEVRWPTGETATVTARTGTRVVVRRPTTGGE